jgi:hypothetical protein
MSFIGNILGDDTPDDKYIDDQSMQEDHRDNKFVGPVIDTACAVYDTMFDALKYVIRGKANVLEKMGGVVRQIEERCKKIADKYKEILGQMNDAGASFAAGLNLDIMKTAFDLLNSNPVLRRYAGEANYWVLWDTLATMSTQGASIGADITSNLKGAIKGTIYALISMTDGLMHFESYITQLTQFWGWLYAKEIWLPLTDSICPQVTCAYYYKPVDNGQLPGSANTGLDKYNPAPGPGAFAPMPIPVFDYEHYSIQEITSRFSYDNPETWDVLTSKSRAAFQKAYKYWRSNYTNETSVNELLSAASRKLTGGKFTAGFGRRKHNHPLGTPLRVGHTFSQLYTGKNESYPIEIMTDALASAYAAVDAALADLEKDLGNADVCARRDDAITAMLAENGEDSAQYVGKWWSVITGQQGATPDVIATAACYDVVAELESFVKFGNAVAALTGAYRDVVDPSAPDVIPGFNVIGESSPLIKYLKNFYAQVATESELPALTAVIEKGETTPEMFGPYSVFTARPLDENTSAAFMLYTGAIDAINAAAGVFYTEANKVLASEIDVDAEVGRRIDGGRQPLFATIGVYGNLLKMCPWDYRVVEYTDFMEKYARIKGSYRIYYRKDNPSKVVFADNIIRAGFLKYIVTCNAAASETISRGSESYTVHIFPSETCTVSMVPESAQMFGTEMPSFASLQRVDAVDPATGTQYKYDLTVNVIPRWPKHVDPEKWSVMDLIHELWLLADSLTTLCGDGGKRRAELNDLLNQFGIVADGPGNGPHFVGQLPENDGESVRIEFTAMNEFAGKLKDAIDAVYKLREDLIAATQAW